MAEQETTFRVLHAISTMGCPAPEAIASFSDLGDAETCAALERLAGEGLVRHFPQLSGWMLLAAGKERLAELAQAHFATMPNGALLAEAYSRFMTLNGDLKALCSDWQTGEGGGLNDHSDERYDRSCIDRLAELHERTRSLVGELASIEGRYARYGDRLGAAVDRLRAGEKEWFTGVRVDSYHTVWMQLHQDLLITLGRERTEDDA